MNMVIPAKIKGFKGLALFWYFNEPMVLEKASDDGFMPE